MTTVVSQVGQSHYYVDLEGRISKQSADHLSHVTERERLAQEAVRESQGSSQDTDPVTSEQPSQSTQPAPNPAERQPDVSMPDAHDSPETLGDLVNNVEPSDSDREEQPPSGQVPHSSSSNWDRRPE